MQWAPRIEEEEKKRGKKGNDEMDGCNATSGDAVVGVACMP
jgi:hypothetical protein